jgi:hypothetical protein
MEDGDFFTDQARRARETAKIARTDGDRRGLEALARHYDDEGKRAARNRQTIIATP